MSKTPFLVLLLPLILLISIGCGGVVPSPTGVIGPPTDTPIPLETATPTAPPTALPSATPLPSPTPLALAYARRLAEQVDAERLMADVGWLADDARQGRRTGSPAEDEVVAWLACG
jgi:hypothetical protein